MYVRACEHVSERQTEKLETLEKLVSALFSEPCFFIFYFSSLIITRCSLISLVLRVRYSLLQDLPIAVVLYIDSLFYFIFFSFVR